MPTPLRCWDEVCTGYFASFCLQEARDAPSAHPQASHMACQIERRLRGQPLRPYMYRDFGSLVSLGKWSTVGNLMGSLLGRGIFVEGVIARSLRMMHDQALGGTAYAVLSLVARALAHRTGPQVKLH
jgi:NADH:ubiquinone reductase (H+-translocating)